MKAIILAAGQGQRMGRLTAGKPRCLLEIGPETILERQLRMLAGAGISGRDVILVTGYRAELLNGFGCQTVFNPEYNCTDNSYSLGLAIESAGETDGFLVLDGDTVFEEKALQDLLKCPDRNCVLVKREPCQTGSTGVSADENGRVLEIGKHLNNSDLNYTCMMKIDPGFAMLLLPDLLSPEEKKHWYTVPLSRRLGSVFLRAVYTGAEIHGVNTERDYTAVKEVFGYRESRILVTGATGFLGKKICGILEREYQVIGVARRGSENVQALDLSDRRQLEAYIRLKKPDIVIHTVAIADPETCDAAPDEAYAVNVELTRDLCEICGEENIKLIFISTDYVFDGLSHEEYRESALRNPLNYYGQTKMMAEDYVRQTKRSLIVRIPIIYGYNDKNDKQTFVTKTLSQLAQRQPVYADHEQIRYPVLIDEVAVALGQLLQEEGIVQLSSSQPVTKYQWAQLIADTFGYDRSLVHPKAPSGGSKRPAHTKMNTDRAVGKGILIHDVGDGLKIMRKQMNCIFRLIYKSSSYEKLYGARVGDFRFKMGQFMGTVLKQTVIRECDCVVPVPNSGLYYAMGLAESIRKPYIQALAKTSPNSRSFNIANPAERDRYLKSKIVPIPEMIREKNVLLVDEAIFTGATLRTVCDMLKACGARKIHICIPTPICYTRCRQYIQPYRTVLTEQTGENEIADYFGVESITYISCDDFIKNIMPLQDYFCYECFENQRQNQSKEKTP